MNTCAGILTSLFLVEMFQRLAILPCSGKKLKMLHLHLGSLNTAVLDNAQCPELQ